MNTYFDYTNQAWIENGVYVKCGHTNACGCFGKQYVGSTPSQDIIDQYSGR